MRLAMVMAITACGIWHGVSAYAGSQQGKIGIQFVVTGGGDAVITTVFPGTPADLDGIHVGDTILKFDGKSVKGKTEEDILALARGEPGELVIITTKDRNGRVEDHLLSRVAASALPPAAQPAVGSSGTPPAPPIGSNESRPQRGQSTFSVDDVNTCDSGIGLVAIFTTMQMQCMFKTTSKIDKLTTELSLKVLAQCANADKRVKLAMNSVNSSVCSDQFISRMDSIASAYFSSGINSRFTE